MKFLLDTNAVTALVKGVPSLTERVSGRRSRDFGLSAIVMHEMFFGAFKGQRTDRTLRGIESLPFPVVEFSSDDAMLAGRIRAALEAAGRSIGAYDTLIAGQAMARNLTVITRNIREFSRVPDLRCEDWES